jgi:DNA-binding beta-propeller fold protein YncE
MSAKMKLAERNVKRTCIAYDPEHERMYVTDFITNNVYVIDTNTLK